MNLSVLKKLTSFTPVTSFLKSTPVVKTTESLVDNLIRKPVGRVATNLVQPYGYELGNHLETLKKKGPLNILKAIISDKPIYNTKVTKSDVLKTVGANNIDDVASVNKNQIGMDLVELRDEPYRAMFGLKSRFKGESPFIKNPDNTYSLNPNTPTGKQLLKRTALDDGSDFGTPYNDVFGRFSRHYDRTSGTIKYYDRWDFDLLPGEKMTPQNKKQILARWLLSKITKPVEFKGEITPQQLKALGGNAKVVGTSADVLKSKLRYKINPKAKELEAALRKRSLTTSQKNKLRIELEKLLKEKERIKKQLKLQKRIASTNSAFDPAGYPVGVNRNATSLADTMRGTEYDRYARMLDALERYKETAKKGLTYADRAIVPTGLVGGLGYGAANMFNHDTTVPLDNVNPT